MDSQPVPNISENNFDCLIKVIELAENTDGSVESHPAIARALEEHVVLDISDGDIELMCHKCPVSCTAKFIGEDIIALLHDREACVDQHSS